MFFILILILLTNIPFAHAETSSLFKREKQNNKIKNKNEDIILNYDYINKNAPIKNEDIKLNLRYLDKKENSKEGIKLNLDYLSGKDKSNNEEIKLNIDYFKSYLSDTKYILSSPLRWETSDWLKATLIAGVTAGLYAFDQDITDWMQDNRSDGSNKRSDIFEFFGNKKVILPSLGAVYIFGHAAQNSKIRRVSLLGLESFSLAGLFSETIKFVSHRHRPLTGDGKNAWDGPRFSTSNLSFPSGHATSAFAIATVIATEYKENPYLPVLAYGISTLTALSRLHDNAHWASDVFLGSAIGYFTAKTILALHRENKTKNITLLPRFNGKEGHLAISYKF